MHKQQACAAYKWAYSLCRHLWLVSSSDNNRSAALWVHHRWKAEWLDNTMRLCAFTPDISTHLPGMAHPRTVWVWLNRLHTVVGRFCLHKWGMAHSAACECDAEKQTVDHVVLQRLPSTFPWTAWPDGSGWWENWMAAQHLPWDVVWPSSG